MAPREFDFVALLDNTEAALNSRSWNLFLRHECTLLLRLLHQWAREHGKESTFNSDLATRLFVQALSTGNVERVLDLVSMPSLHASVFDTFQGHALHTLLDTDSQTLKQGKVGWLQLLASLRTPILERLGQYTGEATHFALGLMRALVHLRQVQPHLLADVRFLDWNQWSLQAVKEVLMERRCVHTHRMLMLILAQGPVTLYNEEVRRAPNAGERSAWGQTVFYLTLISALFQRALQRNECSRALGQQVDAACTAAFDAMVQAQSGDDGDDGDDDKDEQKKEAKSWSALRQIVFQFTQAMHSTASDLLQEGQQQQRQGYNTLVAVFVALRLQISFVLMAQGPVPVYSAFPHILHLLHLVSAEVAWCHRSLPTKNAATERFRRSLSTLADHVYMCIQEVRPYDLLDEHPASLIVPLADALQHCDWTQKRIEHSQTTIKDVQSTLTQIRQTLRPSTSPKIRRSLRLQLKRKRDESA